MKKFLFSFIFLFCIVICSNAAEPATIVAPTSTTTNNFVLYPTMNIYTFLKLDTRNGRIWQVQYSIEDNDFETVLSSRERVANGKPGQFALYPTTNNWTFLLLDTINGDVWHVQWSQDSSKRFVIPIFMDNSSRIF